MTKQDFYSEIDDIIKVNPAAIDTTRLQGTRHRKLLKDLVDYVFSIGGIVETGNFPFDWTRPSNAFGGYNNSETTFAKGMEKFLHRDSPPSVSLQAADNIREYGGPTAVTLNYAATPGTSPLLSILVNGVQEPLSPPYGTQNTSTNLNTDTTFTMVAKDIAGQQAVATASVSYRHKMFIFTCPVVLDGLSDHDITSVVNASNTGTFTDNRNLTRTLNPASDYIYIAYSQDYGAGAQVVTNTILDTSFTTSAFDYTNSQGQTNSFYLVSGANKLTGQYTVAVS